MHTKSGYFQFFTHAERKTLAKGLDWATYQFPIDKDPNNSSVSGQQGYDALKSDNLDFVIHRAGVQGTTTAETATQDTALNSTTVAEYRKRGLKVGTYFYARYINVMTLTSIYTGGYTDANLQAEATKEANNYADILENVFGTGNCGDILPALDFEDNRLDTPYVMTPHQAFVWIKAFSDRMCTRFPQLALANGGKGIMLYTAYYFIGDGTGGNIRHTDGTYINTVVPKLWFSANASDSGYHNAGVTSYDSGDYNMTSFGGYTRWHMWQYATDRNRHGYEHLTETSSIDLDVIDTINGSINDVLVYSETKPKGKELLANKADKHHTHIGEYLPLQGGTIEGTTRVINPIALVMKQENNFSWKLARISNSIASGHLAPEIALIPSSDYYVPTSGGNGGETWNATNQILFKADGTMSIAGNAVLTSADFGTTAGTVAQGNHTHTGVYEPVIAVKNTAFNLNLGTTAGTVAEGNTVHTHTNKTQLDLIPSTLGTNGQVLKSNGSAMVWGTDNTVDLTVAQNPTGIWTFDKGIVNKALNYGYNGLTPVSADMYMRICRVKFQADFGRAVATIPIVHTGTYMKMGELKFVMYQATLGTLHASSFAYLINNSGSTMAFVANDLYYQLWTVAGNAKSYVDIIVKVRDYARITHNYLYSFSENNCTIMVNPDSATTSSQVGLFQTIPSASDTATIEGTVMTASASVAGTIKTITMT